MDTKQLEMLTAAGWHVEGENPLEMGHAVTDSFACGLAADLVLQQLALNAVAANIGQGQRLAFAKVAALTERIKEIRDTAKREATELGWERAYGLVFSAELSLDVREQLLSLNSELDYYDPDSSYEEDVNAFVDALIMHVSGLAPFFSAAHTAAD